LCGVKLTKRGSQVNSVVCGLHHAGLDAQAAFLAHAFAMLGPHHLGAAGGPGLDYGSTLYHHVVLHAQRNASARPARASSMKAGSIILERVMEENIEQEKV
jgi:hypothetical protein